MDTHHAMEKPQPYCACYLAFKPEEAESILRGAKEDDPLIFSVPPVKPKGGDMFIYSSKERAGFKGKRLFQVYSLIQYNYVQP